MRGGLKFDQGKERWDLLPWEQVGEIVKILTFGAEKYSENGWQKVKPFKSRYFAAMVRHIVLWVGGEKVDRESGFHHLAHAATNALFLMWGDKNEV